MNRLIALLVCLAVGGCASMTPTQKKVVTVLVVGTAIAMAKAHSDSNHTPTPERQYPCGCTPPPGVL